MANRPAGFLDETDGTKSSSRLVMFLGFLMACGLSAVAVGLPSRSEIAKELALYFMGVPGVLKTVKDFAPKKNGDGL